MPAMDAMRVGSDCLPGKARIKNACSNAQPNITRWQADLGGILDTHGLR